MISIKRRELPTGLFITTHGSTWPHGAQGGTKTFLSSWWWLNTHIEKDALVPNRIINYLVGGFNPFEKYESKWESSPNRGENKKYLKPPPSYEGWTCLKLFETLLKPPPGPSCLMKPKQIKTCPCPPECQCPATHQPKRSLCFPALENEHVPKNEVSFCTSTVHVDPLAPSSLMNW